MPVSNSVLQERMENVKESIVELKKSHDESHNEIKELLKALNEKVAIQNGRVGRLEGREKYLMGGLSILAFLLGIGAIKMFGA